MDELAVKDEEAGELLQNAQGEVMRLARMVGGMLTLASMSESSDRQKTDLSALLKSGVEMLIIEYAIEQITAQIGDPGDIGNTDFIVQIETLDWGGLGDVIVEYITENQTENDDGETVIDWRNFSDVVEDFATEEWTPLEVEVPAAPITQP